MKISTHKFFKKKLKYIEKKKVIRHITGDLEYFFKESDEEQEKLQLKSLQVNCRAINQVTPKWQMEFLNKICRLKT